MKKLKDSEFQKEKKRKKEKKRESKEKERRIGLLKIFL